MPKRMEGVRITAPVPGTCPVCATVHQTEDPHDLNSLYYQNRFFKAHRRFPTWADAMSHCGAMTKAVWIEKLRKKGIEVVFPSDQPKEKP